MKIKYIILFNFLTLSCSYGQLKVELGEAPSPYHPISGLPTGNQVLQSRDPLVAYRWDNSSWTDSLEIYTLQPQTVLADRPEQVLITNTTSIKVNGSCNLMFDFGQVNAAWFEFDSDNLDGEIEMSISEFNEPAVFNAGSQHPRKTATPVRYGKTWRLELNKDLYEGVRYAWIHIHSLQSPADITAVRLVCQIRPTNYEGSFACSDTSLTRIWYTGAYTVKLNFLQDYFGAILMERSDRHSWTGDAHPSQAASMVAFGNYDGVKANLRYTSSQFNGIASYSLYWVLSLLDYYNYTGDKQLLDEMLTNACAKLDTAYNHYGTNPNLSFYGWDERLGAGFENASCEESQNAYKMLSIRAWNEFSQAMLQASYTELADKYRKYASEKVDILRKNKQWMESFGIFAAADAVNAGFTTSGEQKQLWETAYADRMQRLSYSPFNQFFIIQSMARMQAYTEALATINDCWGGQLRYGATTFFEVFRPSWNTISKSNDAPVNNQCGYTSLTHPWSAGVTKWLSEEILGIKPISPGFSTFTVTPHLSSRITWVKGRIPTPHGKIDAAYNIKTGNCELTVPPGTTAIMGIPKAGRQIESIKFDNKPRLGDHEDNDFVYFEGISEGHHKIKINYTGPIPPIQTEEPFIYTGKPEITEDRTTQGNWIGRYGSKGYFFCNYDSLQNRKKRPDFIEQLKFNKNGNIHWVTNSADPRALESELNDSQRNLGAFITRDPIPCDQTLTIDVQSTKEKSYQLSLYFVDWDSQGRRSAIEVFDLENKKLLLPVYMVRDYEDGKYITYTFRQPVRIRINQVRGSNAALSGLFFD